MSDTTVDVWPDRPLTPAQEKNRASADLIPFGEHGVTPQSFAQAVDFAKMMSTAKGAVPQHLVGNVGACLAVIELGQKFQMSAYMLAMGCFSVNGMLAFTGQTVMAIMNKHMPLAKTPDGKRTRLRYTFTGEHAVYSPPVKTVDDRGNETWTRKLEKPSTRQVTVSGQMEGEADVLTYTSPMVKDINNQKSPLWKEDEDQQLIYWASRRWQRRWWPEGMLGIYDNEELAERHIGADNAKLINQLEDRGQQLMERLTAAKAQTDDADQITRVTEGFSQDHADNETGNGKTVEQAAPAQDETKAAEPEQKAEDFPGDKVIEAEPEPEHEKMPTTVAEWKVYALAWINQMGHDPKVTAEDMNKRWKAEASMRNDCGVASSPKDRDEVYDTFLALRDDKPKPKPEAAKGKKAK